MLRKTVRRSLSTVTWPCNSWGESDRHIGWQSSNWGGNITYTGATIAEPTSLDQLQRTVSAANRVRAIGSAHSFSPLYGSQTRSQPCLETLVCLRSMPRTFELVDPEESRETGDDRASFPFPTLTVDAGSTFSEVYHALSKTKFALPNTAALPQFSVAGATATGTHGSSGMGPDGRLLLSGLADSVVAVQVVGADGSLRTVKQGDADFNCYVVSLGTLGVVHSMTFQLVPRFEIRQRTFGSFPPRAGVGSLSTLFSHLQSAAINDCYSFSAFCHFSVDSAGMLILRDKIPQFPSEPPLPAEADHWGGHSTIPLLTDPIQDFMEGADFETSGQGPWHDFLPAWMKGATPFGPQGAAELQFEYFVPLKFAQEALTNARLVAEPWGGALLYCEIRAVRADTQLLSPYSFNRIGVPDEASKGEDVDSLAIACGLDSTIGAKKVLQAASVMEEALAPFSVRPHWGKMTSLRPDALQQLYGAKMDAFRAVCHSQDPNKKFRNDYLREII